MRALILFAMIGTLSLAGLAIPRVALYGYVWFSLMRPDALAWVENLYPFGMLLALVTLVGVVRRVDLLFEWIRNPMARTLLILVIPVTLSVVASAHPELCYYQYELYLNIILMALVIPVLIRTLEHLKELLLVTGASMGLLGMKFGFSGIVHGGAHYMQGHGGVMNDNNGLALAMTMTVPLCWYCSRIVQTQWLRWAYLAMAVGSMATVVFTFARGAAVAMALTMALMAYRARFKLAMAAGLGLLCLPVALLVGHKYITRLATLTDVTKDPSAASRILYYKTAIKMSLDYPLFGVGFGDKNYLLLLPNYLGIEDRHVVHNTYLQFLVDSGAPALLIYCGLLFGTMWWLGKSIKRMKASSRPELAMYPCLLQTTLFAFAIGSSFYSRIKFEPAYVILMCSASWYIIERSLLDSPAPAEPAPATVETTSPAAPYGKTPAMYPVKARARHGFEFR